MQSCNIASLPTALPPGTSKTASIVNSFEATVGRDGEWEDMAETKGCMRAPAGRGRYDVTNRIIGLVGCHHLAHTFTGHDLAGADRLCVRFAVIHAAAHVRIEREIEHAQQ